MHLDHLRYRRYVDAFVDGELAADDLRTRVGRHLADCPMCDRDAVMAVRIKGGLARQAGFTARAFDRLRGWVRPDPS